MIPEKRYLITVIDGDPMTVRLLERALGGGGAHRLRSYADSQAFLQEAGGDSAGAAPHAVVLGLEGGGIAPFSAFARIRSLYPGVPVVILTDSATQELAEEALRRGAADYFHRPIDLRRLRHVLPRIIEDAMFRRSAGGGEAGAMSMDAAKEGAVRRALAHTDGNIREAARVLDIGRTTMYKLMERYAIDRKRTSDEVV